MSKAHKSPVPVQVGPRADALFDQMRSVIGCKQPTNTQVVQNPLSGPEIPEKHHLSIMPAGTEYQDEHRWCRDD